MKISQNIISKLPLTTTTLFRNYLKRVIDFACALIALFLLSPLLAGIALLVKRKLGSPIIFKQIRPGMHARPFTIYKFRTMTDERDAAGNLLPDENRLTRLGKLMRSTSLDELPELFNVIKGDMSLVGPRPLLTQYLTRYSQTQARRHEIKPGLTGWAQLNGRNSIAWEQKFKLDVWYVDNQSLWLDLKIIAITVKKVIAREGISAKNEATMKEFYQENT